MTVLFRDEYIIDRFYINLSSYLIYYFSVRFHDDSYLQYSHKI